MCMNVQCVEKGVEIFFLRSVMYSVKRSGICMLLKREISFISGVKNSKRNTICINKVVLSLHILCLFPVLKPNILSNNFFFAVKKSIAQLYGFSNILLKAITSQTCSQFYWTSGSDFGLVDIHCIEDCKLD